MRVVSDGTLPIVRMRRIRQRSAFLIGDIAYGDITGLLLSSMIPY